MSSAKGAIAGEYAKAVSAQVRSLMGIQRMTGLRLSQLTTLSQNYLAKRLRDELPFTLNDIHLLAQALGVTYTELVVPPAIATDKTGTATPPVSTTKEVS
jgi:transcriptional regulator with XRE-family HTH domain